MNKIFQLNSLRMWKMQLLDTNHILVRYASEEVATLQANEPNAQPALLVVYDMVTAKILAAYDNASTQLLTLFENFSDFFRNARMSTDCQYMCSPSNNIYARYNVLNILCINIPHTYMHCLNNIHLRFCFSDCYSKDSNKR